jgi:hypothetical protein
MQLGVQEEDELVEVRVEHRACAPLQQRLCSHTVNGKVQQVALSLFDHLKEDNGLPRTQ